MVHLRHSLSFCCGFSGPDREIAGPIENLIEPGSQPIQPFGKLRQIFVGHSASPTLVIHQELVRWEWMHRFSALKDESRRLKEEFESFGQKWTKMRRVLPEERTSDPQ